MQSLTTSLSDSSSDEKGPINKAGTCSMNSCRSSGNRLRALPKEKINKATSGVFQRDM